MSSSGRRPLMHRATIALGLLMPSLEQLSDAFVFGVPASNLATCREKCGTVSSMASRFAESCQLPPSDSSREQRTEDFRRHRYRGQVRCRAAGNASIEPVIDAHIYVTSPRMTSAWPLRRSRLIGLALVDHPPLGTVVVYLVRVYRYRVPVV